MRDVGLGVKETAAEACPPMGAHAGGKESINGGTPCLASSFGSRLNRAGSLSATAIDLSSSSSCQATLSQACSTSWDSVARSELVGANRSHWRVRERGGIRKGWGMGMRTGQGTAGDGLEGRAGCGEGDDRGAEEHCGSGLPTLRRAPGEPRGASARHGWLCGRRGQCSRCGGQEEGRGEGPHLSELLLDPVD